MLTRKIRSKRLPALLWRVGGVEGAARAKAKLGRERSTVTKAMLTREMLFNPARKLVQPSIISTTRKRSHHRSMLGVNCPKREK
jgi:hypothetical protein